MIELLSESTAQRDKTEKKRIYQDKLCVPEYFWYDPFSSEIAGFTLVDGEYQPIAPDTEGRLPCRPLGPALVHWDGAYGGVEAIWLRWATADGTLLPTAAELAAAQLEHAQEEQRRAEEQRRRAEQERQRADRAESRVAELEAQIARLQADLDHPAT